MQTIELIGMGLTAVAAIASATALIAFELDRRKRLRVARETEKAEAMRRLQQATKHAAESLSSFPASRSGQVRGASGSHDASIMNSHMINASVIGMSSSHGSCSDSSSSCSSTTSSSCD